MKKVLNKKSPFKKILYQLLFSVRISSTHIKILLLLVFILVTGIFIGITIREYYSAKRPNANSGSDNSTYLFKSNPQDELSTNTVISDKPRFDIIDYEVVNGDTLGGLADKFSISVDTIKWANSLETENLIPGQILRIPPVTGVVHKVSPGDTIYSLSQKYKSDPQKIVNFPANDFADLDTFALNIGQILFIPDGVMSRSVSVNNPSPSPMFIAGTGGEFIWPSQGKITQYPVSYHMAVDISNPNGPPVAAGEAGVVSYAGCTRFSYGCHVILNHTNGYQTVYGRLSEYNVETGDKVGRGQVIGKMGNTGDIDKTTELTLHFEIRKNGVLLNPLSFLK